MYFDAADEIKKILIQNGVEEPNQTDLSDAIDHGELVAMIVTTLSDELGYEEQLRELLYNAALLHDIGKLKLSAKVYGRDSELLKVEEERYMRMHADLGADMLEKSGYDRAIIEAVRHHHECYDGTGYPNNLQGLNIPFAARFIMVCDVFAALISDRPYRKAFSKEEALEMMIADYKNMDMRLFLSFLTVYNSDKINEIMEFATKINEKHSYKEFWEKTENKKS